MGLTAWKRTGGLHSVNGYRLAGKPVSRFTMVGSGRTGAIMNRVVHIGMILTVSVHMVFGCCSHHVHGAHPVNTSSVASSCPCDQHGNQEGDAPCNQQCGRNRCVFISPDTGDSCQVTIGADCLPVICSAPTLPGMNETGTVVALPHLCESLISLHLLNQAFLL